MYTFVLSLVLVDCYGMACFVTWAPDQCDDQAMWRYDILPGCRVAQRVHGHFSCDIVSMAE